MINILFSPSELKKLKECINKQKYSSTDKDEIKNLNNIYSVISCIEKNNIKH